MLKVVVPVREEILRAAERRRAAGFGEDIAGFLGKLIDLGFEHQLRELYRQFMAGDVSFGYFARELGVSTRDLYALLEDRELLTSNIGAERERQ